MDYKNMVIARFPKAYIKEVDRKDIGGLGNGAPRTFFEVRVPVRLLWGLINSYLCLGKHVMGGEAWHDAYINTLNKK